MDDWQNIEEKAFNKPRNDPYGRTKRRGKAGGRKGAAVAFDPEQALGVYRLFGDAVERLSLSTFTCGPGFSGGQPPPGSSDPYPDKYGGVAIGTLELHELTDTPGGFVGSLVLGDKLRAAVLFGRSKQVLRTVVAKAEAGDVADASGGGKDEDDDSEESESDESADEVETTEEVRDRKANKWGKASEKYGPKFWFQWRGKVATGEGETVAEKNEGYIVFAETDCRTFKGSIDCKAFDWKVVPFNGRKHQEATPERFGWNGFGA